MLTLRTHTKTLGELMNPLIELYYITYLKKTLHKHHSCLGKMIALFSYWWLPYDRYKLEVKQRFNLDDVTLVGTE